MIRRAMLSSLTLLLLCIAFVAGDKPTELPKYTTRIGKRITVKHIVHFTGEAADCHAGRYQNAEGKCYICPKNTYSGEGDNKCTDCPEGHTSRLGSKSKGDCYPPRACGEDTVSCPGSTKCINRKQLCDAHKDCPDGTDESAAFCEVTPENPTCPQGTMTCDDGLQCVSTKMKCNGRRNCRDGTDESEKTCLGFTCAADSKKCADGLQCFQKYRQCDGRKSCNDGSDELKEFCRGYSCTPGQIKCADGLQCVAKTHWCDGRNDCKDGSDEIGEECKGFQCDYRYTKCADGEQCVLKTSWCDGKSNCHDGSDEASCIDREHGTAVMIEEHQEMWRWRYNISECLGDGDIDGHDYRGRQHVTKSGKKCQAWDAQEPNKHTTTAKNYPGEDLRRNFCRNPNGHTHPWCYNGEGTDPAWEDCDIPFCNPCKAGFHMTDHGCRECEDNTYSRDGAVECTKCPDGKLSLSGSTSLDDCEYAPCEAGYHMTGHGCEQCPENTFSGFGASICTSCPDGKVSPAGSTSKDDCAYAPCSAGDYMTDSGCQQCGENTFSGDGASSCTSCPDGMLSAAGSTSADDCSYAPCSAGSYMTDSGCQQCGENTFSGDGASSCTSCPDGMLSAAGSTSADDCSYAPCSAGSYMTDSGCQQCGENTFSGDGASSCTSCPDGTVSSAGSTSEDDCTDEQRPTCSCWTRECGYCSNLDCAVKQELPKPHVGIEVEVSSRVTMKKYGTIVMFDEDGNIISRLKWSRANLVVTGCFKCNTPAPLRKASKGITSTWTISFKDGVLMVKVKGEVMFENKMPKACDSIFAKFKYFGFYNMDCESTYTYKPLEMTAGNAMTANCNGNCA